MVAGHLRAGTLVELIAGKPVDVPLYWQYWRLNVQALARMTAAVQAQARSALPAR
jgi:LysR family transcriptional regulator (chromosome initiation inhibitor)